MFASGILGLGESGHLYHFKKLPMFLLCVHRFVLTFSNLFSLQSLDSSVREILLDLERQASEINSLARVELQVQTE